MMLPESTDIDTVREAERVAAVTLGSCFWGLPGPAATLWRTGDRRDR